MVLSRYKYQDVKRAKLDIKICKPDNMNERDFLKNYKNSKIVCSLSQCCDHHFVQKILQTVSCSVRVIIHILLSPYFVCTPISKLYLLNCKG